MSGEKNKFRKLSYKIRHDFLSVENIVLVLAVLMCLVWTYQAVVAMERNWRLSERINAETRSLQLLKIEVEAAELENEYYKTEEYQELAARRLENKQLPGERMVYLEENSEEAKNKHKQKSASTGEGSAEYTNFEKWILFLFPSY